MVNIEGYMEVSYKELQKVMAHCRKESGITDIKVLMHLSVKSLETVSNSFNQEIQKVSDEKISQVMDLLKIDGCVMYVGGKKKFFILETPEFLKIKRSRHGI